MDEGLNRAPQALGGAAAEGELQGLRHARDRLDAEVGRLAAELAQVRREQAQASVQTTVLAQAAQIEALRDRAMEAQGQAERLRGELGALLQSKADEGQVQLQGELAGLRSELRALRVEQAMTRASVLELRRDQTAVLASVSRSEPIDACPPELLAAETHDYLVLARSSLMNPQWYRTTYPDVAEAGADPLVHYLQSGWREGRRPGPGFDGQAYLAANPDVARADINPLVHYQCSGAAEHRPIATDRDEVQARATVGAPPLRFDALRIVADLASYEDFLDFRAHRPEAFDQATEQTVLAHARLVGTRTEFLGVLGPQHTKVGTGDTREWLMSGGLTSRGRAIADTILETLREAGVDPADAVIYGHEAVTLFAGLIRRRFPRFIGTEYAETEVQRRRLLPFIHNDICKSQFPDDSFDLIFSCDVFEHVYDRDAALRETARTLVEGGTFLATFPFFFNNAVGSVFAETRDGQIVHHLADPIYHGNPMDEDGGSLVFEIPGWDILARAREAGFSKAVMRFMCDEEKGVTASGDGGPNDPRGVFILVCRK